MTQVTQIKKIDYLSTEDYIITCILPYIKFIEEVGVFESYFGKCVFDRNTGKAFAYIRTNTRSKQCSLTITSVEHSSKTKSWDFNVGLFVSSGLVKEVGNYLSKIIYESQSAELHVEFRGEDSYDVFGGIYQ